MSTPSTPTDIDAAVAAYRAANAAQAEALAALERTQREEAISTCTPAVRAWLAERPQFAALTGLENFTVNGVEDAKWHYPLLWLVSTVKLAGETVVLYAKFEVERSSLRISSNVRIRLTWENETAEEWLETNATDTAAVHFIGNLGSLLLGDIEAARRLTPEPEAAPDLWPDTPAAFTAAVAAPEDAPDPDPLDLAVDALAALVDGPGCHETELEAARLAIGIELVRSLRQLAIAQAYIAIPTV